MGEFIIYYRGKAFGGIYDDRLLVKSVPVAVKMMPDAEMEPPYDGAKKMILWIIGSFCVNWLRVCGKNCRRKRNYHLVMEIDTIIHKTVIIIPIERNAAA